MVGQVDYCCFVGSAFEFPSYLGLSMREGEREGERGRERGRGGERERRKEIRGGRRVEGRSRWEM